MAHSPRRCTSRQDWEDNKALIREQYLTQNQKLTVVTAFLNQNCGFEVTPRQVKAKIKEWAFDNKRTFGHHYRAMLVVANHRRRENGLDTVFLVPKNASVEEVCPARVKKEVDRQKGVLLLPSLEEAETVLKAGNITWHLPRTENSAEPLQFQIPNQDHANVNLSPSLDGQWAGINEVDDAESSTGIAYSLPTSPLELIAGSPAASLETSNADMESLVNLTEFGLHIAHDIQQYPLQTHMQSVVPDGRPAAVGYALHGLPDPSTMCLSCPSGPHQDFDFWKPKALHYWCPAAEPKMHVSQWASPWLWHAFGNRLGQPISKADGIDTLKRMLSEQRDNQYILPCLSWMITILGAYGKHAELQEFLSASCVVIDEVTGQDLMYNSTFHYALAVHQENDADKRKYGENFARYHEAMKLVWGEDHPNVLVNVSFWAWYLLDEQKFDRAIDLLEGTLPFFENVMGRHDLLTINGRAILSRAYRATGNLAQAIYQLEQALYFLGNYRQELSAVSLELHGRLATLLKQAGQLLPAESHLRHCIDGSVQIFGLQDRSIWYHINLLCKILNGSGRHEEVDQLLYDLQQHGDCPLGELEALRERVKHERCGMQRMYT